MNKVLELKELSVKFGEKNIFNKLSFQINKGDIVSLIGKNGSGKSTLIKTILGLNKEYDGEIVKYYDRIGYVPQKLHFDKTVPITVSEFLDIYNNKDNDKISYYFNKFESESLLNKRVSSLSGGELQKVLIINSILSEPDFLVLDEPTAGIDIVGEETFYGIIQDIQKLFPDLAILIVSHNMKMVYSHSTNVVCLHKNCCCIGTPAEIHSNKNFGDIFGDLIIPYSHTHDHTHNHN